MTKEPQAIIIGGGPGGASAAIYLARYCHNVVLFDAPEEVHGRTNMAPDIDNVIGFDPLSGPEFMARIERHLNRYPQITVIKEKVVKLNQRDGQFVAQTTKGTEVTAPYAILAVGLSDNMPPIDGLDPYYDHAIFHCLTCDWYERRDKKIAIVANNDRGITTALMIESLAKPPSLVVVPGSEPFQFSDHLVATALTKGITVHHSPIKELMGQDGYLHAIRLNDGTQLEVEVLFTKLGHKRFDDFLDSGGINVARDNDEGFITVDFRSLETSVPNLFAVGPCNTGPDQIIIAGGQGAVAGLAIHSRIVDVLTQAQPMIVK